MSIKTSKGKKDTDGKAAHKKQNEDPKGKEAKKGKDVQREAREAREKTLEGRLKEKKEELLRSKRKGNPQTEEETGKKEGEMGAREEREERRKFLPGGHAGAAVEEAVKIMEQAGNKEIFHKDGKTCYLTAALRLLGVAKGISQAGIEHLRASGEARAQEGRVLMESLGDHLMTHQGGMGDASKHFTK